MGYKQYRSYGHFFVLVHGPLDGLCGVVVAAQHVVVALLHLEVDLEHLVLVVLPQLPLIQRRAFASILHHARHLLLVVLELLLLHLRLLLGIPGRTRIAVVRNAVELVLSVVEALRLLVHVREDRLDDSVVGGLAAAIEDQPEAAEALLLGLLQGPDLLLEGQDLGDVLALRLEHLGPALAFTLLEGGLAQVQLGQDVLELLDLGRLLDEALLLEQLEGVEVDLVIGLGRDSGQLLQEVDGAAEVLLLAAECVGELVLLSLDLEHLLLLIAVLLLLQPGLGQLQLPHLLQQLAVKLALLDPEDRLHPPHFLAVEEGAEVPEDGLLELEASSPAALQHHELPDHLQDLEVLVDGPGDESFLLAPAEGQQVGLGGLASGLQLDDDGGLLAELQLAAALHWRFEFGLHVPALMVILEDLEVQSLDLPRDPEELLTVEGVFVGNDALVMGSVLMLADEVGDDIVGGEGGEGRSEGALVVDEFDRVVEVALQFLPELR